MATIENIYIGGNKVKTPYLGSNKCKSVWLGDKMVWGTIDNPNVEIHFDISGLTMNIGDVTDNRFTKDPYNTSSPFVITSVSGNTWQDFAVIIKTTNSNTYIKFHAGMPGVRAFAYVSQSVYNEIVAGNYTVYGHAIAWNFQANGDLWYLVGCSNSVSNMTSTSLYYDHFCLCCDSTTDFWRHQQNVYSNGGSSKPSFNSSTKTFSWSGTWTLKLSWAHHT